MSRIVVHPSEFNQNPAHYNILTDKYFFESLKNKGYEVVFSKDVNINKKDVILFVEAKNCVPKYFIFKTSSPLTKIKIIIKGFLGVLNNNKSEFKVDFKNNKKILLIFEGEIHAPENHNKNLSKYSNYILTWNDELLNLPNFIKINIPQQKDWELISHLKYSKKKLLTLISSNIYSFQRNELYSERRKIIRYAEKRLNTDFDLFGFNWNKPSNFWQKINKNLIPYYKSYKGSVKSKAQTLSNYRFAIVYENYRTVGYVTEKIFDCLRSNCIPIYLGAPNIASILPENIYIDRTKFSTDKDLLDYISKMKEETYNKYLTNIQRFINSDEFQKHFSTEISKKIHQLLTIDLI